MSLLISLLIVVVIFALAVWAIGLLPVPANVKNILYAVLAVILIVYLLGLLGLVPAVGPVVVPRR